MINALHRDGGIEDGVSLEVAHEALHAAWSVIEGFPEKTQTEGVVTGAPHIVPYIVRTQVVVGSALPLVHVDDAVQIGEVAVQIHPLCVAAADEPVLDLSRLNGGGTGDDVDTHTRVKGSETATEPSRRVVRVLCMRVIVTCEAAFSKPSGFMEGMKWMRVVWTRSMMVSLPCWYWLHMYWAR
ncbi:hypothetical protein EYF80_000249 [Liparis tanakae]|uniref:Uncharacterized protein n=1 Tax=Liparis tanakae TaxID=230148 RepID=A0A4Z2JH70_9TELE|nr:hypothetical protein EYF80_000249 [Liparis tanakae]